MRAFDRVSAALSRRPVDRVPRYDYYWPEFQAEWKRRKSTPQDADIYSHYGIDIRVIKPDLAPRVGGGTVLEATPEHEIVLDGWGSRQKRLYSSTSFFHPESFAVHSEEDFDGYHIDSALDDRRYDTLVRATKSLVPEFAVFVEITGPYTCLWRVLGVEPALLSMVERPKFVQRVADLMARFQAEVGCEALRRVPGLLGVLIDDDVACNRGMLFSPAMYRTFFLRPLKTMCAELKAAGGRYIVYHSDGDIRSIIPTLIEAGVDAIHPLEPRAGMDVVELQHTYGDRLSFIGNMDNSDLLRTGSPEAIRQDVRRKLTATRGGGYIPGSHSIGDDVPVENYDCYIEALEEYGTYAR